MNAARVAYQGAGRSFEASTASGGVMTGAER